MELLIITTLVILVSFAFSWNQRRHFNLMLDQREKQIDLLEQALRSVEGENMGWQKKLSEQINISNEMISRMERRYANETAVLLQQHRVDIEEARKEAIKKSKEVAKGQVGEHLLPLLTDKFCTKDLKFLGAPVDYIAFEGMENIRNEQGDEITSVTFFDVKTGNADLTKVQRRIRDAIKAGRVKFEVIKLDTNEEKDDAKD